MGGAHASDDWIAVDWGTSRLRAWVVSADGNVRRRVSSDAGMGTLSPDGFEPALLDLIGDALGGERDATRPIHVLCCGMVGARQGWFEAPYRVLPCAPTAASALVRVPRTRAGLVVDIVPGLAQRSPADVMRGEETQIAGLLAERPGWSGTLCLPGTHTKWVRLERGHVVSFTTAMSGELFALLRDRSVLRHGLAGTEDGDDADRRSDAAFDEAVRASLAQPAAVAHRLFSLRAQHLLEGLEPPLARSRLSGLLLGLEIAGLADVVEPGAAPVAVIGAPSLARHYGRALAANGTEAELVDGERLALAGLVALRKTLPTEEPGS